MQLGARREFEVLACQQGSRLSTHLALDAVFGAVLDFNACGPLAQP